MFAFWILEISTICVHRVFVRIFLGGQMFPIDIMPAAVSGDENGCRFIMNFFVRWRSFSARLKGPDLVKALAIQTGWLLLTWMWARFMWQRGLGHYQAVGG